MSRIIQALHECLAALPRQQLRKVGGIGVSGQMHGVLFWKTGQGMRGSGGDHMLRRVERESAAKGCLEGQRWGCSGTRCLVFCVRLTCTDVLVNLNHPFIRHHQPISQEQEREFSRISCRILCHGFSVAFSVCQCLRASLLAARRLYRCRRCQHTEETLLCVCF